MDDRGIDFYMNEEVAEIGALSVLIKSRAMVSKDLMPLLRQFLQGLSDAYSILLTCDIGGSTELFFIFVDLSGAIAAFESSAMADGFGFDSQSGQIERIQ